MAPLKSVYDISSSVPPAVFAKWFHINELKNLWENRNDIPVCGVVNTVVRHAIPSPLKTHVQQPLYYNSHIVHHCSSIPLSCLTHVYLWISFILNILFSTTKSHYTLSYHSFSILISLRLTMPTNRFLFLQLHHFQHKHLNWVFNNTILTFSPELSKHSSKSFQKTSLSVSSLTARIICKHKHIQLWPTLSTFIHIILDETSLHSITHWLTSGLLNKTTLSLALHLFTPDIIPLTHLNSHYTLTFNFVQFNTNTSNFHSINVLPIISHLPWSLIHPCTFIDPILRVQGNITLYFPSASCLFIGEKYRGGLPRPYAPSLFVAFYELQGLWW